MDLVKKKIGVKNMFYDIETGNKVYARAGKRQGRFAKIRLGNGKVPLSSYLQRIHGYINAKYCGTPRSDHGAEPSVTAPNVEGNARTRADIVLRRNFTVRGCVERRRSGNLPYVLIKLFFGLHRQQIS